MNRFLKATRGKQQDGIPNVTVETGFSFLPALVDFVYKYFIKWDALRKMMRRSFRVSWADGVGKKKKE